MKSAQYAQEIETNPDQQVSSNSSPQSDRPTCHGDGQGPYPSCSRQLVSRPVLPDRELTKGGSAITSGCQQRARAMKLRYVAWWWRSRERKLTGFGSGFGRCLVSVSTSRRGSEKNPKGSGSGTRSRRDRENEGQRYGKYLS